MHVVYEFEVDELVTMVHGYQSCLLVAGIPGFVSEGDSQMTCLLVSWGGKRFKQVRYSFKISFPPSVYEMICGSGLNSSDARGFKGIRAC